MSFLTSSAINKSGKTIAPKAANRRRGNDRKAPESRSVASLPTPEPSQADATDESDAARDIHAERNDVPNASDADPVRGHDTLQSATPASTAERISIDNQGDGLIVAADQSQESAGIQATKVTGTKRKRTAPSPSAGSAADAVQVIPSIERMDRPVDEAGNGIGDSQTAGNVAGTTAKAKRARQPRGPRKGTATSTDTNGAADTDAAVKPAPRKRTKRTGAIGRTEDNGQMVPEAGSAHDATAVNRDQSSVATRRKLRKRRPPPPDDGQPDGNDTDDSEHFEIDESSTTLLDLATKRPTGQTSEREKKMRLIDWKEVARLRRATPPLATSGDKEGGEAGTSSEAATDQFAATTRAGNTMQLRIVNGQIVLDEASQQIDRQAQALADAEGLTVDENADLTKRVNNLSWINDRKRDPAERVSVYRSRPENWNDDDTDKFYEALRMFGTDFHIISKMFPPRTRRHIKLKFVREERLDPDRINLALSGAQIVPMDLDHFAMHAGVDASGFKDPEVINAELKAKDDANTIEIEKKKAEALEAQKQREIMNEQREKEKGEREREKASQKAQRDEARRRKRSGRGMMGTGTF